MNSLLAGGDSFTAHLMESNLAWPNHIKEWIAENTLCPAGCGHHCQYH